jgi:hypothetical protein
MNTPDLQNAVRQALTQNAGGSPAQNQFQHGMNMQNAFMPQQHWNQNFQYGNDPLKQNPYAFVQEKPDSYFTVFPDPSRYAPQISQGQYNAMMQQDYGQNPNVNTEPQAPAAPAAPSSTMDYMKWLDGSIWDTEIRNVSGKEWSAQRLGDIGKGYSYANYQPHERYAPPKPGEGATQQDWVNYQAARSAWDQGMQGEYATPGKFTQFNMDSILQGN